MYKIKMHHKDVNNLKIFLERIDLKGAEVSAYVDIVNAIMAAEPEEKEEANNTQ